jgi:hypothetical protein
LEGEDDNLHVDSQDVGIDKEPSAGTDDGKLTGAKG